jgi:hypothetical protein
MNRLKIVYYRKFRISSLALVVIGAYLVYKYWGYEVKLTPQAFFELLKMNSFEEVQFVEEEYFRNKQIRLKKVTGKINGETYFCEVLSFD